MTHFSLKSTAILASFLAVSLNISAFAAAVKTECDQDPLFAANTCDVCYTEVQKPTKTSTGWTAELSDVVIPWEHSNIELQEIITESEQKLPEIISSTDVKVTPLSPQDIWGFHTDIVWLAYESGSDREFYIEKGAKVGLYTLKPGVKLSISGKGSKDTIIFKSPLFYEEYDKELFESSSVKSRNICVLNTFFTGSESVTPTPPQEEVVVPSVEPEITVPPLDAAGPEDVSEKKEEPKITPEQTETQAGPEVWIFILLAFVFSSSWTAWRKQKI